MTHTRLKLSFKKESLPNDSHFGWLTSLTSHLLCLTDDKGNRSLRLTADSCALDRISSYTVSLLRRHYSIDDVLSRDSFPLHLHHSDLADCALQGGAVKPLPLLSFSDGKGSMALAPCHQHWEDEDGWQLMCYYEMHLWIRVNKSTQTNQCLII